MSACGFAHEELLRVEFDRAQLVLGAVIRAVGEYGLVSFVEQFHEHVAVPALRDWRAWFLN